MGVYIPPPRGDDKSKSTTAAPTGSSSSSEDTVIIIKVPNNPSLGLITGPLTPAADNLPALYGVTSIQFLLGLWCFKKARNAFRPPPLPNSMIPSRKPSFFWGAAPAILGTLLITGCGLELGRFLLPYEPWYNEAQYYRKLAIKNGIKPSPYFGAYQIYKPLALKEWSEKVIAHLKVVSEKIESSLSGSPSAQFPLKPSVLAQLNKKAKYNDIYVKLHDSNRARHADLLNKELVNVNESNKFQRLIQGIETNPNYLKPEIHLESFSIESEDEFDLAWTSFDPWDELILESYSDMRMIPIFIQEADKDPEEKELTKQSEI